MPLSIWQQLANASPGKAKPKPKPKKLTKPRGVYTKGPVRSNGTTVRAPARSAPRTSSAPAHSHSHGGGGGGAAPAGAGLGGPVPASGASVLAQLRRQAAAQVAMELDPQIRARQFARSEAGTNYKEQIAELQKRLGLTKTELTQLYGSLDALLQNNAAKQQTELGKATTSTNTAYDQLRQMVGQNYDAAGQATSAELSRLGQGGADVQGRLAADKAFTEGQVGSQQAAATSTIDAIKAAAGSEASQLRGAAAATAPMLIGQAQLKTDDASATAKREYDSTIRQLNFQIRELTGSRKAKVEQMARELQAAQQQAEQDAQQLQFLNSIRAAQVGISQGQLDLARQRLGVDIQSKQNDLVLRARSLQAQLDKANGPKTGMERAYSYLGSGYKGRVPQAQLQQALEDAINGNSNDPGWRPGTGIPGYDPKYLDQYRRDIQNAVKQRGWSSAELSALLNATGYYFNR